MGSLGMFGTVARTKADLLSTVTKPIEKSKMIARSTLEILYSDGTRAIRYHDTDVITFNVDGSYVLNSGGHRTLTTRNRINDAIIGSIVWQEKGQWYVNGKWFYDGITFSADRDLLSEVKEPDTAKINRLKKDIKKFTDQIDSLNSLPVPDSGDCWFCLMKEEKSRKPLGDCTADHSHLISHLEENYLTGSLIINALREKGYTEKQFGYVYNVGCRSIVKRAVSTYLKKRLIIGTATR